MRFLSGLKNTRRSSFIVFLLTLVFSTLCCGFFSGLSASAYNFAYDGEIHYLTYSTSTLKTDDGTLTAGANGDNIKWTGITPGYSVREMQIYFQEPIATEPTLASFTITFDVGAPSTSWYYGITWREALTLSDSCMNNVSPTYTGSPTQLHQSITCSYLVLINEPNLTALHGSPNGEIFFYLNQTTGDTGSITVTPFFTRGISNNGLSANDRQWLESVLQSSTDVSSVVSKLNEVKSEQQATTDAIEDNTAAIEEQTEAINDMNDYMQDNTPPDLSEDSTDSLGDSAGWLPAGPVDSILTIPITFLQGIISVLTGSDRCQPVSLPLPFVNQSLSLPCMRPILNQMGFSTIYEVVGGVISMFIIWDTLKWLYAFVDKTLTFREDNSSIWGGL